MRRGRVMPKMGERGWFPDHTDERRAEFGRTTPGARVAEAIAISRTVSRIGSIGHRLRAR